MIESIYSSEAHEGTARVLTSVPKNVRQIGKVHDKKKIYVEDYVMTYIKHLGMKSVSTSDMVVFLGQFIKLGECQCIFISGAVEVKDVLMEENLVFTNETWTSIYDDIKKYFTDVEIVGWCLLRPGLSLNVDYNIKKVHVDNFAGQDKALLLYDSLEREEAFYIFEEDGLKRQEGYYIYYEKNADMQNYMIVQKVGKAAASKEEDRVVREARNSVLRKKEENGEERKKIHIPVSFVYGFGVVAAAIALVSGVQVLNNSEKMDGMQQALNVISQNVVKNSEELKQVPAVTEALPIETKSGGMSTIEEGTTADEGGNDKEKEGQETQADSANAGDEKSASETKIDNNETKSNDADKKVAEEDKEGTEVKQKAEGVKKEEEKKAKTEETKQAKQEKKSNKTEQSKETSSKNYYVIQDGDTLASISLRLYHTTKKVKDIMELNGIEDQDMIISGQKLVLP